MSRTAPNGNASVERSAPVTAPTTSRLFGPITPNTAHSPVTSTTIACASPSMWRSSHARSRRVAPAPLTTRNSFSANRVTVSSASIPPRSFSQCVYTSRPGSTSTSFAADALQHAAGVAALDEVFREARLVEQGGALACRAMLGRGVLEPVLAAEGVLVAGLDAFGGEPVRPAPSPPTRRSTPRAPRAARGTGECRTSRAVVYWR